MTEEQKDIVTIDDKEFDVADLNDNQRYMVNQIRDLNVKIAQAQFGIDQLRTAQNGFTNMLVESVKEKEEEAA